MKISAVDVLCASYPTDDVPPTRRSFVLLKLTTDDGIVGWGEASDCYGHRHPLTIKSLVEEDFKWLLLGQEVEPVDDLVSRIRRRVYPMLGARELGIQVISAIEIALWDIRGKRDGRPVSEIIGPQRDRIPLYAGGKPAFTWSHEDHLAFLQPAIDAGFGAVKIRTGKDLPWDMQFVRSMRDIVPDDVELMVDGKYNYFPESAVKLSWVLADAGVLMFEEPVPDSDLDLVAWVAANSPVPLAYGEHSFTVDDFRELISRDCVGVIEPDASVCGGIGELRKIAQLGLRDGLQLIPHCGGLTAVGLAANLHAAATLPELRYLEYDARDNQPLRDELAEGAPFALSSVSDGCMPVPTGPGLGVEIREAVLEEYPHVIDEELASTYRVYGTPHI